MDSLEKLIDLSVKYFLAGVHTAVPGKIVKYDPSRQEATVQVMVNDKYQDDREVEVVPIDGVPVVFPSAGGGAITFPVEVGDGVLVIFSERSLDVWVETSQNDPVSPGDKRRHNITDAIAIPGLTSFKRALGSSQDGVEIKYQGSSVLLKKNGDVEITPATGNLKVNGTITATNDVVAQGGLFGDVSLKDHKHTQTDPTTFTSKPNEPI